MDYISCTFKIPFNTVLKMPLRKGILQYLQMVWKQTTCRKPFPNH